MPVEPVPTRPTGPSGRRAILSAVVPVAALGLVVVAALVGTAAAPQTVERPAPPTSATGNPPSFPDAPSLPGMDLSIVPRVAFRLPVRTVDAVLDARGAGEIGDGLVAIAGYVVVDPRIGDCAVEPGLADREPFCRRLVRVSTRFGPTTPPATGVRPDGAGRSLRAHVLPGTPLPEGLESLIGRGTDPEPWPLSSVVIGRFGDPRAGACRPPRIQCGDPFVLERVAWIDGRWMDRPSVRDPVIPASQAAMSSDLTRLLTSRESDRGEVILSEALLTADLLRDVDPAAAAALGDGPLRRVWYVRSIGRGALDRSERPIWPVTWAVLDDDSGLMLATGDSG